MISKPTLFLVLTLIIPCVALAQQHSTLVVVKINESIMPIDRGHKYEDPLNKALKEAKLGEVTGGGTMLSKIRKIEWVGIDVELNDVDKGVPFLRHKLIELGVPPDTTLEYRSHGRQIEVAVGDQ